MEQDLALDFIRRTDSALRGEGYTNNRHFERQLKEWLGMGDEWARDADHRSIHRLRQAYAEEAGQVTLEHLASNWISCSWIGGPHGPVSPSGMVQLAKNFGKYPTVEEIERDLDTLAFCFPWLKFDLAVWGHTYEEDTVGEPSCFWHLESGSWERQTPRVLPVSEPDHVTNFIKSFSDPLREQTWDVRQIDRMWGERHRADLARAVASLNEETADD